MDIGDFPPDYQTFYNFLLAHDALIPFLTYSSNSTPNVSNPINSCLAWAYTPQGHAFWQTLSNCRPKVRISGALFKQYCELLEQASLLSQPYEFW